MSYDFLGDYTLEKDDLSTVWNSKELANLRNEFLEGKKPEGCARCWAEEAGGFKSKRIRENERWAHVFDEAFEDPKLRYVELKFGNICNLKCRICNPVSSTRWVQEQNFYDGKKKWKKYDWPETNEKFWSDLQNIVPNIDLIETAGGEPLLSEEHFSLLEYMVANDHAKNTTLHYNTNGTIFPNKSYLWDNFKYVIMALSIDGIEKQFEYQRHPAKWSIVENNIKKFQEMQSEKFEFYICLTVNMLNIYYLDEFISWADSNNIFVYLNLLHDPKHYNIKNVPSHIKPIITEKINKNYLDRENVQNILGFMNSEDYNIFDQFVDATNKKDNFRKENFASTFNEYANLLEWEKWQNL